MFKSSSGVRFYLVGVAAVSCLAAPPSYARWEHIDEAAAVNAEQAMDFVVNKDGTYDFTYDRTIEIRRDGARQSMGTISFGFSAAAAKLVSIKAETVNGKKHIKVGKDHIENKLERGADLGFDKINRVTVAFPDVEVGSRLHYVYTLHTHTVPVKGLFSETIDFGTETPDLAPSTVRVHSKIPLQVSVRDKEKYLSVIHKPENGGDFVEIKLTRDAYFKAVNEKDGGWFPEPPNPTVDISSSKDFSVIGRTLSPAYEAELTKPLPAMFAKLADVAKAEHRGFTDQVDAFTAALADNVRYMGDWRTVKGGHIPRPLAQIAETAFGDCKDMASVTAAALRRMGYKANVALIFRGEALPQVVPLPTSGAYNHAIVRAEDDEGHVRWVDPTNRVSHTAAIRVDIAGRQAMVIDGEHSRLEQTPELKPADSLTARTSELDFLPEQEEVSAHHKITLAGSSAEGMTGLQLATNKEQIGEMLLRELSDGNEVMASEVAPFELSSRVVKDLTFDVSFRSKWTLAETTAGHSYRVPASFETLRKLDLTGRVSAYYLGHPESSAKTDVLQKAQMVGKATKPCTFASKWMDGSRDIAETAQGIVVTNKIETKTYGITPVELHSDGFKQLQSDLKHCMGPYVVIFNKGPSSAPLSH